MAERHQGRLQTQSKLWMQSKLWTQLWTQSKRRIADERDELPAQALEHSSTVTNRHCLCHPA